MELKRFLKDLSCEKPTPGGGSAAALAAALAASLVAMVAGLSAGRDARTQKEIERIREKAGVMRERLLLAITEDAQSFDAVMAAIRLPKDTERERLYRSKMIQEAYRKASVIPKLVSEYSVTLLGFCAILISKGNPNARSDAGVAAFLANAAMEGGALNVRVNLLAMRDKSFKRKMEVVLRRLKKEKDRRMAKTLEALN